MNIDDLIKAYNWGTLTDLEKQRLREEFKEGDIKSTGTGYAEAVLKGLGKEEPIVENEHGGMGAKMSYLFTGVDPHAMFRLAEVVAYGATKYARDNWRKVTTDEHINHALQHIYAYMADDKQDDHLGHAFCRLMMAIGVEDDKELNKKD